MALVTVHKHAGGIHSAIDLQDGCFGTTTVMRIAAMFVPHNIFEVQLSCQSSAASRHPRTVAIGRDCEPRPAFGPGSNVPISLISGQRSAHNACLESKVVCVLLVMHSMFRFRA